MIRRILNIAIVLIATALSLTSCFKDEVQGTLFKIAVYSKNVETDDHTKTKTELYSYAFNIQKGSNWEVTTWQDALDGRITNKDNPSQSLTKRDVTGTFNAEEYYQVTLDLKGETVFMVIVDPTNEVYATRRYDTPINWPETKTELHLYAWRKSGTANGWDVVNPYPDKERESLIEDNNTNEESDQRESNEENE